MIGDARRGSKGERTMATTRGRQAALATGGLAVLGGALAAVVLVTGGAAAAKVAGAPAPAPAPAARAVAAVAPVAGATVTVTGNGSVTVVPDTLTLQIGATTNAPTAVGALDGNDGAVTRLQSVLRSAGVAASDMQTSDLQLSANTNSRGTVTGYQASDQLTVTMHQLSSAGAVIDAAAHAVGNDVQIQGITFSRADTAPYERAARTAAVHQAATEAAALAAAAGDQLGGVVKITDEVAQPPEVLGATPSRAAAVPVQAGTATVSAQVQVVYALVR